MKKFLSMVLIAGLVAGVALARTITNELGQVITVTTLDETAAAVFDYDAVVPVHVRSTRDNPQGMIVFHYNVARDGGGAASTGALDTDGVQLMHVALPSNAIINGPIVFDPIVAISPATASGRVSFCTAGSTVEVVAVKAQGAGGLTAVQWITTNAVRTAADMYPRVIYAGTNATAGAWNLYVPYILSDL